jgi:hypothetical protein
MRDGCDAISAANPQAAQSQRDSVGAVGDANRAPKIELPRELLFKRFDFTTQNVPTAVQDTNHGGHYFISVLLEECPGVRLRNIQ